MSVLATSYYGNTLLAWLIAGALLVATAGGLAIARVLLLKHLRPRTTLRAFLLVAVRHTRYLFLLVIGLSVATIPLSLPTAAPRVLRVASVIVVLLQMAWWAHGLVGFWIKRVIRRRKETDVGSTTAIRALGLAAKATLWVVFGLAVIAALGVDVTAMIAGLGIGGLAIALAVQNIVGDLFASVSIMLDKPFLVGDLIKVGEQIGTVEEIGIKTTRVRSLSGEQLIFGNSDLLQSRIQNFRRMSERRIVFSIGVEYGTSPASVEAIPGMMRAAIEAHASTRVDRVHFKAFDDSALTFEAVYHVLGPDYIQYMDIQQGINLTLLHEFAAAGINFAFPTRTVQVHLSASDTALLRGTDTGRVDGNGKRPAPESRREAAV